VVKGWPRDTRFWPFSLRSGCRSVQPVLLDETCDKLEPFHCLIFGCDEGRNFFRGSTLWPPVSPLRVFAQFSFPSVLRRVEAPYDSTHISLIQIVAPCASLPAAFAAVDPMLRLPRHSSARLARSLREPAALGAVATRPCPTLQRGFAASRPHEQDNTPPPVQLFAAGASARDGQQRPLLASRRFQVDRRRAEAAGVEGRLLVRPLAASSVTHQWRGLATSGKGKGGKQGGGGGDEEGLFDRLKKTFAEEIEKVQ